MSGPPGLIARLLLSGNAEVVFDGLDELVDTSRRAEVTAIVEQFSLEYPLASVLVTSRLVGYDEARLDDRQFRIFRIGQFDENRTAEYVRKWFAQETDIDPAQADRMSASFMLESAEVPDLRGNPLMLALMCILYRGEGSIPRNRPEVYEQCATLLFRKWDARRRIYVELRARHLVEPALGYLAYWLFTRDQARSAVTERELIVETTEFLHDRGFESKDEAADAAREFVEFCRGRAWVFTDAGTTATGQSLYTFTHRTFLEYFAATRLSAVCDTPEDLAKTLRPHIARQEWEVVAELSVQMKSTVIDRGAERIYTTLLNDRRRRSAQGRGNILSFLGRCLKSVEPPPRVVRELTQACLDHLFKNNPNKPVAYLPLTSVLTSCSACREIVGDEIRVKLDEMVSSSDSDIQLLGLYLATSLVSAFSHGSSGVNQASTASTSDYDFWSAYEKGTTDCYRDKIIQAARFDRGLMFVALNKHLITTAQAIDFYGGPQAIFEDSPVRIFAFSYIPWMLLCLYYVFQILPDSETEEEDIAFRAFDDFGSYLMQNPHPPWVTRATSVDISGDAMLSFRRGAGARKKEFANTTIYLAIAVTYLISLESSFAAIEDHFLVDPPSLGPFSSLWNYIQARADSPPTIGKFTGAALPVPEEFQGIFKDWAAGRVSFNAK
jgi:hypothetical protein